MNNLPDPYKLTVTVGALEFLKDTGTTAMHFFDLLLDAYKIQPDECFDGGNDKRFFTFKCAGQKFFVAENEVGGVTAMLPEEY